ncbi:MAG: TraB/GumN family protein [Sphingomonadaceae bacterium]
MKKLTSALLGATLFCTPAMAATDAATVAMTDIDPALWVVEDHDTTIYLFGTVHILKPGLGWFDDGVKKAFDASDELVIEMIEPDQAAMMRIIKKVALDPRGKPISQRLSETERASYLKTLEGLGIPYQAFEQAKPWFAAMSLSVIPLAKLGYDPANGPEKTLRAAAEKAGKKIGQLETPEEQLGFLDKLTEAEQIDYLNKTVAVQGEMASGMDKLIALWGKADIEGLEKEITDGMASTPAVNRVLLDERNVNWAKWIKARLDTPGTVFLAVGSGHLAGKGSVQHNLKALNIDSVRVNY